MVKIIFIQDATVAMIVNILKSSNRCFMQILFHFISQLETKIIHCDHDFDQYGQMSKLCKGTILTASHIILFRFATGFQRGKYGMFQPIRNKNGQWQPYCQSVKYKIRELYNGPCIDAPYQTLFHLAKQFGRRKLFNVSLNQK